MTVPVRILVVDDEPEICTLLEMVLGEVPGWTVESVPTAELAQDRLGAARFDLLVCDHHLPGISGVQLAEKGFDPQ